MKRLLILMSLNRWLKDADVGLRRYLLAHIILPGICNKINRDSDIIELYIINNHKRGIITTNDERSLLRLKQQVAYYKQFL